MLNTNDFSAQQDKRNPAKPITDINYDKEREKRDHDYKTAKQSQLSSEFDKSKGYQAPEKEELGPAASPVKGQYATQNKKLQFLTSNISNLQGCDANQFYHKS